MLAVVQCATLSIYRSSLYHILTGASSATRVTPRVVALFPPANLVLEISATGYTDITWLVNGTAMHAFSRLELEDDSKSFILNNTSVDDAGVYEADVISNNGTITVLDFLVSSYCKCF